jgi:DNA mismatch repair protein MSH2
VFRGFPATRAARVCFPRASDADKKGFVAFFRQLPVEEGVVRFFDRREFYSVHGPAALALARRFYKTTSVVKHLGAGEGALPGVTLNRALFETVLRALLLDGGAAAGASGADADAAPAASVELWEERSRAWVKTKSASPGRLGAFEDDLFRGAHDMGEAPVLAAARVLPGRGAGGGRTVGVAYVNTVTRELGATAFDDDDAFCTLEAVLLQVGARECVLARESDTKGASGGAGGSGGDASASSAEGRRLRDALARAGAHAACARAADFSGAEAEHELRRLLRDNVEIHRPLLERPAAAAALGGLIRYAELGADASSAGRYTLAHHDTGRYMRLDAAAARALHVMREGAGGAAGGGGPADTAANFSLYALLCRCRTPMGKRLLARWLKQPLTDVAAIGERHDVVEALLADAELREALRGAQLRALPDVERLAAKLERRGASLQDLCRLYQASCALPLVAEALSRHEGPHAALLAERYAAPLAAAHDGDHLAKFEALLEAAVDLERVPDEYVICASYDPALGAIAARKAQLDGHISGVFDDVARRLGLERERVLKLDHAPQHGWFFRLTRKEEAAVRGKLSAPGFIALETRKDGVKFTSKELKAASDARVEAGREYDAAQRSLVARVVDVAASFADIFRQVAALLAQLDVLAGFADLAACAPAPYCRPVMHPAVRAGGAPAVLRLTACRHPCVEALCPGAAEFVPNDCEMAAGESWFTIVTGPNMGGKSTFIRQVGVAVLLAQVGCFVPAAAAELSVRDAIFARVGAGDCTLRGISTFMAEMLETAAILKAATSASLILIDELGRGTSTYDGFGLAWAIGEHIVDELRAPCLFATHFHELTSLRAAGGRAGVVNRHVSAAADAGARRLTMLYELRPGACAQSFGIHCAEFARFPPAVLAAARAKAAELEAYATAGAADEGAEDGADDGAADGADGAAKKKRRLSRGADDVARGAAAARAFLAELAAMPRGALSPAAAAEAQARMMEAGRGSDYLARLLEGAR